MERERKRLGVFSLNLAARLWRACLDFRGTCNGEAVTCVPVKAAHLVAYPGEFFPNREFLDRDTSKFASPCCLWERSMSPITKWPLAQAMSAAVAVSPHLKRRRADTEKRTAGTWRSSVQASWSLASATCMRSVVPSESGCARLRTRARVFCVRARFRIIRYFPREGNSHYFIF